MLRAPSLLTASRRRDDSDGAAEAEAVRPDADRAGGGLHLRRRARVRRGLRCFKIFGRSEVVFVTHALSANRAW